LDSALAVIDGPAASIDNAVDAMANLVAKSLLSAQSRGDIALYRVWQRARGISTLSTSK
jgi:hypothetical protein